MTGDWHAWEASFAAAASRAAQHDAMCSARSIKRTRRQHASVVRRTSASPKALPLLPAFAAPRRVGTMVDAFRAQLDALMGVDRNGDRVRGCSARQGRAAAADASALRRRAQPRKTTVTSRCAGTTWRACVPATCSSIRCAARRPGGDATLSAAGEGADASPRGLRAQKMSLGECPNMHSAALRVRGRCMRPERCRSALRRPRQFSRLPPLRSTAAQETYQADKAAGKVNFEPDLRARAPL